MIFFNPAAERLFKMQGKNAMGHAFSPQDVEKEGWQILTQVIFPSLAPRVISRSEEKVFRRSSIFVHRAAAGVSRDDGSRHR